MPILNKGLLLRLIIVFVVLAGGLFGLHRVQADRVPKALLWQANMAAEKGKTDKAIFYMRQYLEFNPDDHEQALTLADMILARATTAKDYTNAHFLYEKVLRESPTRTDVGRKLVTLCLQMGRSEDALIHAERLLKQTPNDGVLLGQLAECQMLQNKPEEARKSFEAALAFNPKMVRPYEQYARLLVKHFNKRQEAAVVLDRMCQVNAGLAEAFLIRARYHRVENKPQECQRDLDRLLLLDPENADALVMLSELEQARGDLRKAKNTLSALISTYPRDPRGYRSLSWIHLVSGNQAEALTVLEQGTTMLPDAPELLTPLADIWLEQGETERAMAITKKLEARKDAIPQIKYLRGRLLMKEGKWNEALAVLDGLRTEAVGMASLMQQLNLLVAACHERRGDRDGQVEALRRILASDPSHLGAKVAMGNAHLATGARDQALKEYQAAIRVPYASTSVWLTYASIRLSLAKELKKPEEWQSLRQLLLDLRKQHKHVLEPVLMLAEIEAAQGRWAEATTILRDEVLKRPEDPRLWAALATITARSQGTIAAMQVLAEGQMAVGDSVELKLARARLWLDDIMPARSQRLAQLEQSATNEAERVRLLSGLFDLYTQTQDDAGCKRVGVELAARNPADRATRRQLYALALRTGEAADKARWREELRNVEGTSGRSHMLLEGLALLDSGSATERQLSELHDLAQTVLNVTPDDIDALHLSARIADRRGNSTQASSQYELAFALEPTQAKTQVAWLRYALQSTNDEAIKATLNRLSSDPRMPLAKLRLSVEASLQSAPVHHTVRMLNSMGDILKREPRMLIWAGQLLEKQGKITDALAFYRTATTAFPKFGDGWSARLMACSRVGASETAECMQQAQQALDRSAFFTLVAECAVIVKSRVPEWQLPMAKPEDHRAYAQACVNVCEARSRLEDALPILTALSNDTQAPEADREWAKRVLTALAAAKGTQEQRQGAIAQLRMGNANINSADEARSRVAALMVALRSNSGDDRRVIVREMIQLLDAVTKQPQATANDWFSLAQLHRTLGDRAAARRCLEQMLTLEPNNLFFVSVNVDDLLSEQRLEEARRFLPKLQEGLHDVRVAGTVARFYTLLNEPQQVLEAVDRFVRTAEAGTTDRHMRERQAAEVLDQATRLANMRGLSGSKQLVAGAAERYRAALKAYPDAIVPYTALLAFDGQVKPAFEDIERYQKRLSPATKVLAGVGILRSGFAEPAQFQTVQDWIDAVLTDNPQSIPMKLNLAELHALRQDFSLAESLYRDVLKSEPKNIVALNNLAWILAPKPEAADQALVFVERAIERSGTTAEILDTRARILISAGKYERAIADLNDAINQGQTPLRYFHLAIAQYKMSNNVEAVKTFQLARARGLDPKSIHPYDLPVYKQIADEAAQAMR